MAAKGSGTTKQEVHSFIFACERYISRPFVLLMSIKTDQKGISSIHIKFYSFSIFIFNLIFLHWSVTQ